MKERIRELAEQSSIAIHPRKQTGSAVDCVCGSQFDIEKFAELIVRECAQAADAWMEESEGKTFWVGHGIKEHFGIFSELNNE